VKTGSVAMPRDGDPMNKTRSKTSPPLRLSTNAHAVKKGTWYFRKEDVRPGPVTVSTVVASGTTEPFVFRLTLYENGKAEP
jgi:hypothetical protein